MHDAAMAEETGGGLDACFLASHGIALEPSGALLVPPRYATKAACIRPTTWRPVRPLSTFQVADSLVIVAVSTFLI